MAYSKANFEISCDKGSLCFKQSSYSKICSSEFQCVHCVVQSVPSWYKQSMALFTALFRSNRCLDSEDFLWSYNEIILT